MRIIALPQDYDFIVETHALAAEIEGESSDSLEAVVQIHETLRKEGRICVGSA